MNAFFPVHDLTHSAVESVLGFDQAFSGSIRAGWEIGDFTQPGVAARVSPDAMVTEFIVGILDLERGTDPVHEADTFNEALASSLGQQGLDPLSPIAASELTAIRALRDRLAAQGNVMAPGETLELGFPPL